MPTLDEDTISEDMDIGLMQARTAIMATYIEELEGQAIKWAELAKEMIDERRIRELGAGAKVKAYRQAFKDMSKAFYGGRSKFQDDMEGL